TRHRVLDEANVRQAWTRALADESDAALLALDTVGTALPRLADLVALRRGEILLAREAWSAAREAFALAGESVDAHTRLRAQIGVVHASLREDRRDASAALDVLLRHHPELPEEPQLRLIDAERLERR